MQSLKESTVLSPSENKGRNKMTFYSIHIFIKKQTWSRNSTSLLDANDHPRLKRKDRYSCFKQREKGTKQLKKDESLWTIQNELEAKLFDLSF